MNLLTSELDYILAVKNINPVLQELYANIPDKKRISYGRVHTIKVLESYIYTHLVAKNVPVFEIGLYAPLFEAL